MIYRVYQQQLMEVFMKMYDLPTRSEVDEIHHSIYGLRKEVKSLKKALAEFQTKG
jgi:polyhydroxyalkanoate synthesis regulator phasin